MTTTELKNIVLSDMFEVFKSKNIQPKDLTKEILLEQCRISLAAFGLTSWTYKVVKEGTNFYIHLFSDKEKKS